MQVSQTGIRLGFVALNDAAPLVIAKERGYFRRHGLQVELVREPSWANVRDKVQAGLLDGAQMLAPMPLATTLGLDGPSAPMCVPVSLSLNGNAVTLSNALADRCDAVEAPGSSAAQRSAAALRTVIHEDREKGRPPLRFGVVYPFSCHNYELVYWAASAGVDPGRDLELSVIPPVSMADALGAGHIDGYCVGEPWNQLAREKGIGRRVVSSAEIWSHAPEKVLAFSAAWVDRRPEECRALVRALIEASRFVDDPAKRLEVCHVIAGESFVDAPVDVVAHSLCDDPGASTSQGHVFHRGAATFPWVSHGMWYLSQMLRWGQAEKPFSVRAVATSVIRPDLYREAAAEVGEPVPTVDEKTEGRHAGSWTLEAASEPIAMGRDAFMDGRHFDPDDVVSYLEQSEVTQLRVRLDDLAAWNR